MLTVTFSINPPSCDSDARLTAHNLGWTVELHGANFTASRETSLEREMLKSLLDNISQIPDLLECFVKFEGVTMSGLRCVKGEKQKGQERMLRESKSAQYIAEGIRGWLK